MNMNGLNKKNMKEKFLLFGYLVAILCLSGCNKNDELSLTGIAISPATTLVMEAGETLELTATLSPSGVTEEIYWISYDQKIASIEGYDTQVTLKALTPGTTKIFATNRTKTVISEEITVIVNSSDYAAFVVGNYSGAAEVTGMMPASLSGVNVKLERKGAEQATVKLTVVAEMPGLGVLTIIGDAVQLTPGVEPETYRLNGSASVEVAMMGGVITFNVSGAFKVADSSLLLKLTSNIVTIDIDATPGTATDYAALLADDYTGTANLTGMLSAEFPVQISLTRMSSSKAGLSIIAANTPLGPLTIECKGTQDIEVTAGAEANTCTLNGKATLSMQNMILDVSGTYDIVNHTLTLLLSDNAGMVNVSITAVSVQFNPSDYAKVVAGNYTGSGTVAGMVQENLSDVQILLERVDDETLKLTIKAQITALGGLQTIIGETVTVSSAYELSGAATLQGMGFVFVVTGAVNPTDKTLTLNLSASNIGTTINLTAEMQE